ncbi:transketolase [candidate division KSB1 bacterium]|nr:transketolase [candidate division KSB1 bacterium]
MAVTKSAKKTKTRQKSNGKIAPQDIALDFGQIIEDYRLAFQSRQASLIGRKEVMSGKAKFGIFGDGKEIAQIAMAKAFRKGDFRSGYYRDQTFMFATGMGTIQEFFSQLYAHADVEAEPFSAGRQMNNHFATRSLNPDGSWKNLTEMYNCSADLSPTGSQMPRLVGLAYASRLYREIKELHKFSQFSKNGQEIAFGTIGNATCAEGMFWEAVNAIGVLRAPVIISIWDDHYGISVSNEHQVTNENISALLEGFRRNGNSGDGYEIFCVKGWDYEGLIRVYLEAADLARQHHVPAIIHVDEMTQPQGHSTSGSHERYKSKERLTWEEEFDCLRKMREWILDKDIATAEQLDQYEQEDTKQVMQIRDAAWEAFQAPIREERNLLLNLLEQVARESSHAVELGQIKNRLAGTPIAIRRNFALAIRETLMVVRDEPLPVKAQLREWKKAFAKENEARYSSHLYSESEQSALKVPEVKPVYSEESPTVNGFELLNSCFDTALSRNPLVIAFGEDVGFLGGVNQGFRGMQKKYGELRVADTGIRECTILGQAIGMAMRGLRPIAEIQYLDYILYALQIMSDDLATLRWRTRGGQKAPVIVRTRGHRLEGVWHSGSPMAALVHLLRGLYILVPRNMTQAAGFYNTMLQSDESAVIIEVLNGYRLKETLPDNLAEFTLPLGVPEVLRAGADVTIVTYGAICRLVLDTAAQLERVGISAEVIDVRSLMPFDRPGLIGASLKKTSRIVFVDEDVPGGATSYMMQEVLEKQGGYQWLDSEPRTVTAKAHRPAFGSDGDYFSKPNVEQIFEAVYGLMHEFAPAQYPIFY